ncbi:MULTISPECIES: hypothetical protein [Bradyrhizobium]|jgi:hypothetical protein|uniref:Uncharacterized protein n=1 Tax=Bradyrhizobium arachidis TaxID=858423 RepID=A0AAE7NY72_9BRAD|nr:MULTISPECIES: hypothetical protein [Bradyrhizobium]QOG21942.1 hypothetical protein FOM02_36355 [Bradyrhizobium sp. SEMIA]QOZ71745.1 hypothetical protein WN72_39730 [Bradyrhizobium arachidis]UFW48037.1 hypothetical protein BaraCB756_38170 [Bradyrhizobium arachidis]SFV17896.1 hypothetical protein SAMN05192541_1314 [Bradyrhizobium arachidis]
MISEQQRQRLLDLPASLPAWRAARLLDSVATRLIVSVDLAADRNEPASLKDSGWLNPVVSSPLRAIEVLHSAMFAIPAF